MAIIYLLAAVQALFLVSLLLNKNTKSNADYVLATWLSAIAVHTLIYFLYFQFQLWSPLVINLNAIFPYLQGPFLLAYVAALVGARERFSGLDYLHFLPAVGFFVFMVLSQGIGTVSVSNAGPSRYVSIFEMRGFWTALLLISVPAYIAWSLVLMRKASRVLDQQAMSNRFRWIWFFIIGLGVIWILSISSFFMTRSEGHDAPPHLVFWAVTLFVYGLGYLGLTRTSVFSEPELALLKQQLQPKYRKSGLKADEAQDAHRKLIAYVEREQAYLDGELSLKSLARALALSTNHLSQVINEFEQCNFYDFINRRRVEAACRQLDQTPGANLLELAMAVGFNSKSSFNRAFLKFAGKTPSEYTQTH
jgi:AraC-like DNA-binding protein